MNIAARPCTQMRLELQNKDFYVTREGAERPPKVAFREINPFKLWVSGDGLGT